MSKFSTELFRDGTRLVNSHTLYRLSFIASEIFIGGISQSMTVAIFIVARTCVQGNVK